MSTRVKRTEQDMLASFEGDTLAQASYVKTRISKLEEKIAELLAAIPEAPRSLLLQSSGSEHLSRYLP